MLYCIDWRGDSGQITRFPAIPGITRRQSNHITCMEVLHLSKPRNNPGTYFLLSRNIFESQIWREDSDVVRLFIWAVGHARHQYEPKKYPHVTIYRGEFVTSLSHIAEENEYIVNNSVRKWSRTKVFRMLQKLEKDGYIKLACDTYGTHVKICNYEFYQLQSNYTCNNSVTTCETINNDNNEKHSNKREGGGASVSCKTPTQDKKIPFGEFNNVMMTQAEFDKLAERFGKVNADAYVERCSSYVASVGKRYKSHYATICGWMRKDNIQKPEGAKSWEQKRKTVHVIQ